MKTIRLFFVISLFPIVGFAQQVEKIEKKTQISSEIKIVNRLTQEKSSAINQEEVYSLENSLNENGIPKYIDTGDPKADSDRYVKAKELWIKEHPDQYKAVVKSQSEEAK